MKDKLEIVLRKIGDRIDSKYVGQREEMIFLNEIWNEIFDILGEEE